MVGKYIESDTFLMPLIPSSNRKAQLVKETIKRHLFHGADGEGVRSGARHHNGDVREKEQKQKSRLHHE